MIAHIYLYRENLEIARIDYEVTDVENARGFITQIESTDDKLVRKINRYMAENSERVAISGGIVPSDLGSYCDGVVIGLEHMGAREEFTFNATEMPWPEIPAGSIS